MQEERNRASSFGDWLRRQRKARDWTQTDLAQRVGCALDTIKKIETAALRPSKQLAARIATVLDIPPVEREAVVRAARDAQAVDRLPRPAPSVGAAPPQRYQLRSPLPDFIGQQVAITTLLGHMQQAAPGGAAAAISGVRGMGGIGKTELAVLVANRLRDVFPDAQIVVNFRGTSDAPLLPEQALQMVIRAFTPDARPPDDLEALQRHYHSVLHGQRVLILADDARDADQVRPLLPPSGCGLLMTSRRRFSLPGMTTIDLEVLDEAAAVMLLQGLCGRLSAEETRRLARACGYLPLALRVSGSLLHNDPALAVASYLQQLTDARQRLPALRDPDDAQLDVAATLALSYAQLDADDQRVFRQLGVLVSDFAAELAEAVVELPSQGTITETLHALLRRNLVIYDGTRQRWRLHDLLRDLARSYVLDAGEWEAVMWRYAHAAVQIAQETQAQYWAGKDVALAAFARFDAEHVHIDAAWRWTAAHAATAAGDGLLRDLAVATRYIGELRYDLRHERIPQLEYALAATRRLGDRQHESQLLIALGIAVVELGDPRRAIAYYEQSLACARELGERNSEAVALGNLGIAYTDLGEVPQAIRYLESALALNRELGKRLGEAMSLTNLGQAYKTMGDAARAIAFLEQALTTVRELGNRHGEAIVLTNLGASYLTLGDVPRAIMVSEQALATLRAMGDRGEESEALSTLARAYAAQSDVAKATALFEQALTILRAFGDRPSREAPCCWQFGLALAGWGERERALSLLRTAVAYEQRIGHAKAAEHAALLARLEAGEEAPAELLRLMGQRAVGQG